MDEGDRDELSDDDFTMIEFNRANNDEPVSSQTTEELNHEGKMTVGDQKVHSEIGFEHKDLERFNERQGRFSTSFPILDENLTSSVVEQQLAWNMQVEQCR